MFELVTAPANNISSLEVKESVVFEPVLTATNLSFIYSNFAPAVTAEPLFICR